MEPPPDPAEPPAITITRMTMGHWLAQAIHVACELHIPDLLAGGPASAGELAARAPADPESVDRLLRALAAHGVVGVDDDGRFHATALSEELRRDVPNTLGAYAHWITGALNTRAWGDLLHAVRTGETAFDHAFGAPFFEYLGRDPEEGRRFNAAMTSFNEGVAQEVVAAYDFGRFGTVVDVGGGQGLLLATILRAHKDLRGVLFDRPDVVAQAAPILSREAVLDRVRLAGGDFFRSVAPGGDAYLLKAVVHDWDDERAARILASCHAAMASSSTLLVIERVLPERVTQTFVHRRAAMMDLNMLALTGGRERTRAEFESLFEAGGFALRDAVSTPSGIFVVEGAPR